MQSIHHCKLTVMMWMMGNKQNTYDLVSLEIYFNSILLPEQLFTQSEKTKVPFSVAIKNVELMYECFPEQFRTGTARLK